MEQGAIAMFQQVSRIAGGGSVEGFRFRTSQRQNLQELARTRQALHRIFEATRVIQHHVTHQPSNVARWLSVVADESYTLGSQASFSDFQNLLAHFRRRPSVNAVSQDVIECAERLVNIQQVLAL